MVPISEIRQFLDFRKLSKDISVPFVPVSKVSEFLVERKAPLFSRNCRKMLFHSPVEISRTSNRNFGSSGKRPVYFLNCFVITRFRDRLTLICWCFLFSRRLSMGMQVDSKWFTTCLSRSRHFRMEKRRAIFPLHHQQEWTRA